MEFSVIHHIKDAGAWQECLESHPPWPESFTLLAFVEAKDKSQAMCIWQAPDQDLLQQRLDEGLGRGAVNVIVPVDVRHLASSSVDPG